MTPLRRDREPVEFLHPDSRRDHRRSQTVWAAVTLAAVLAIGATVMSMAAAQMSP